MIYLYHIRKPAVVTAHTPVLMTLHGMGTNNHDLADIAADVTVPFVQIDIQGNRPFSSGYAFYLPDHCAASEKKVLTAVLNTLDRFVVETLRNENLAAGQPLYLLGFSQGAILSLSFALLHPGCVAGAVVLSGRLPGFILKTAVDCPPGGPAFFIGHGQDDPLFPLEEARQADAFLRKKGYATDYHEYLAPHGVTPNERMDLCDWFEHRFVHFEQADSK